MTKTNVAGLDITVRKTLEWLRDLQEIGDYASAPQAYTALHSVLHAIRDTLGVNEAAQLAAGMPMLIRGLYFDGWNPAKVPNPARSKHEFLDRVGAHMGHDRPQAEHACRCVFRLLERKIVKGEIQDVRGVMHHEVRELWLRDTGAHGY